MTNKSPESPIVAVDTTPNTGTNDQAVAPVPVPPPVIQVKDCGTVGNALKLGTPSTYENNPVLSCLGESALSCENAHGIIKDDLFPTFFEIIKSTETPSSCDFKLSYGVDSTLTDITGKSLAGQYVSCPLGIVKSIDNTKPATPKFNAPNTTDLSKYAADIYFYGTLGLFIENNLDLTKIQTAGCSGDYIDTMIAGYKAKK